MLSPPPLRSRSFAELSRELSFAGPRETARFAERFHLDEQLARTYPCALGKRVLRGKLYVGAEHLCFRYAGILRRAPVVLAWDAVAGVAQRSTAVVEVETADAKVYAFVFRRHARRAAQDVSLFWRRAAILRGKAPRALSAPTLRVSTQPADPADDGPANVLVRPEFEGVTPSDVLRAVFEPAFLEGFHNELGHTHVHCESWREAPGQPRRMHVTYSAGSRIAPVVLAQVDEDWTLRVEGDRSLLACETLVSGFPYSSYFKVATSVSLRPGAAPHSTSMRVRMQVVFLKDTVWRRKIEQTTTREYLETYTTLRDKMAVLFGSSATCRKQESRPPGGLRRLVAHPALTLLVGVSVLVCLLALLAQW